MLSESELASVCEAIRNGVGQLRQKLASTEERAERLELEVKYLREMLRRERIAKYGPASEKLTDDQLALLDAEPVVHAAEVESEAALSPSEKEAVPAEATPANPRRSGVRGAQSLPAHLPREEMIITCSPEQAICPCCQGERAVIGYEEASRLHRIPARYCVRVYKREKRACRRCEEGGVATAPMPAQIIDKGIVTNELIVDVLVAKYELHQPLYRQQVQMERESGVILGRSHPCCLHGACTAQV